MPSSATLPPTQPSPLDGTTPAEMKRVNAQLGAGFTKKTADKVYMNKNAEKIVLSDKELLATDSLFIKSCTDSTFAVDTTCTKIFVEGCKNVKLTFNGRIMTHTLEIWKCENVEAFINTSVQTLQIDISNGVAVTYTKSPDFNRLVWSAVERLSLQFLDLPEQSLTTGSSVMAEVNKSINVETDQFIARILPNKVSGRPQLVNELIVRLENGFPTTEREARQFDERQEANLQALAKQILGDDIVLGKKKDSGPKIGRNDPCKCGSGKKYKKCCGTDAV
eukprot:Partr_v1_DN28874_c3_g1_i3_m34247 putative Adenylate cyclase associated (CAP) C terminal